MLHTHNVADTAFAAFYTLCSFTSFYPIVWLNLWSSWQQSINLPTAFIEYPNVSNISNGSSCPPIVTIISFQELLTICLTWWHLWTGNTYHTVLNGCVQFCDTYTQSSIFAWMMSCFLNPVVTPHSVTHSFSLQLCDGPWWSSVVMLTTLLYNNSRGCFSLNVEINITSWLWRQTEILWVVVSQLLI